MEPWEIMISESQERMVAIVRRTGSPRSRPSSTAGSSTARVIGEVTETGLLRAYGDGEVVGGSRPASSPRSAPATRVERAPREPPPRRRSRAATRARCCSTCSARRAPLAHVRDARYDQLVAVAHRAPARPRRRRAAAASVATAGSRVTLDGTGRVGSLDPFTGGAAAILEAARNVACAGGEPLGFTDCLNFGNPEKPEIGWELAESIEGMARACEALGAADRLRQRLALQRHRRPLDPPDARRRLRRARARRPAPARPLAARRCDPPCVLRLPGSPWIGAAGPLRHGFGAPPSSISRRRQRSSVTSSTSRRPAPSRTTSRGAASPSRLPRLLFTPASVRGSTFHGCGDALRRGLRPGHPRAAARSGRDRPARLRRRCPQDRRGRRRRDPRRPARAASRCLGAGRLDVRRVRHPLGRTRRGTALLLRPVRVAAPRPGVGGHRRLGGRAADSAAGHGPRGPGLQRAAAQALPGEVAIGHTRYSTTGGVHWSNAQPLVHHGRARTVALGHNGNLTNTGALRDELSRTAFASARPRTPK